MTSAESPLKAKSPIAFNLSENFIFLNFKQLEKVFGRFVSNTPTSSHKKLKDKGVLPSITVHQNEFVDKVDLINELIENDLIYTTDVTSKPNYRVGIIKARDKIGEKVAYFFKQNLVFYQNNEIGEIVSNYIKDTDGVII